MTLEELADPRLGHRTDHSIRAVARGYCRWPSLDEGELVQEGIVGLLRAVHRFDSGVDAPFWAYAVFWVRQAMQRLVAELMGAVVLSDRALRQMARVKAARREYQRTHSGEPTSRDLAALTGFDVAHVDGLTVAERRPRALGEPVREDSGSSMTFADLVVDARAEDAYEEVASSIDSGPIEDLLDRLNERERTVIRARFGLGGPQRTLREVGLSSGSAPSACDRSRSARSAPRRSGLDAACPGGGLIAPERRPTKTQAFYRNEVVVVILQDAMTTPERTLAAAGKREAVLATRRALEEVIRPDLVSTVEQLTGRKVIASMSAHNLEPDIAAEVFVLDRPVTAAAEGHQEGRRDA